MSFGPDMAFAAAQILAVLLVATILDPWARRSMAAATPVPGGRRRMMGAWISYLAKVLALVVLLFDMQLVLFDNTWEGGRGYTLAIANYVAVAGQALSILLAVLTHMGALGNMPARDE